MTNPKTSQSRRRFLRCSAGGLGTLVSLPFLESLLPRRAFAQAAETPLRLCVVTASNGMYLDAWRPAQAGALQLSGTLAGFAPVADYVTVLSGMSNPGPGTHGSSMGRYLTATDAVATNDPAEVRTGISVDQLIGNRLQSYVHSIQMQAHRYNTVDVNYHDDYSNTISYNSEGRPIPNDMLPITTFNKLFAGFDPETADADQIRRQALSQSVLDFVLEDANSLNAKLSHTDRDAMDRYFSNVRDLELRLQRTAPVCTSVPVAEADYDDPLQGPGSPDLVEERIRDFMDIIVLAFQCNVTQLATLMTASESSSLRYTFLPGGADFYHHEASHWQPASRGGAINAAALAHFQEINRFHVRQVNYLAERLRDTPEGSGNLLDNTILQFGSVFGNAIEQPHIPDEAPLVLIGRGRGTVTPGFNRQANAPLANLYRSYLEAFGMPQATFGNSTGIVSLT